MLAYMRNKNHCQRIRSTKRTNNKTAKKTTQKIAQKYLKQWHTQRNDLWCKQIIRTNVFTSFITSQTFKVFHQFACESHSLT